MKDYLKTASTLALQAGDIMLKYFKVGMTHKFKEDLSIVTNADEEINKLVINTINKKYPKHSIIGEEESSENKSNLVWLCDPIDGTWQYAKGIPVSVFSLALVVKGKPQLGVVYDPFTERLLTSVKGKGAFLNGKKIKVSNRKLKDATINIDWWPECEYDVDTVMHKLSLDTSAYVLHFGSVVNAGSLVASGQYEATVFGGTIGKSVDIAAVKVIVEEAGGKVTNLHGNEQLYSHDVKGAIVSNGIVHSKILKYTRELKLTKTRQHLINK